MNHLAIIADGNRRWAKARNLPSNVGHAKGLEAIERTCEWAITKGIPFLTVFCFSTENWSRGQAEVGCLMSLARTYFNSKADWYRSRGIMVRFLGRNDRLPPDIMSSMQTLTEATKTGEKLTLVICVDYGGRDEIARAVAHGAVSETAITEALTEYAPEPDMIIRTGGRHRLSNFLLWQAAYAELYFTDLLFPDLDSAVLDDALRWYDKQVRTFGK